MEKGLFPGQPLKYLILSKKGPLHSLHDLISALTAEEKATIRTYLGLFIEKGRLSISKSIRLFDEVAAISSGPINEEAIELAVYNKINPETFYRQVRRLRDKILEALIIDVNVDREGAYPEKTRVNIAVRKQITQGQILQNRGLRKHATVLFEKVIEQCKNFELYDELLIALRLYIKQHSLDEGGKQLAALQRQYEKFDYCKSAVMRAEILHRSIIAHTDFYAGQTVPLDTVQEALTTLREDFRKTRSSQIGNYYFHIEAQYYQQLQDYRSARKSLRSNQRLLENSVAINTPQNIGATLFNLADNDLFLYQFERSYETSDKAISLFKKGSFNYEQCAELLFYAKYYLGEYDEAANIIFQLLKEVHPSGSFRNGKRSYLLANTYFMMEDFGTALRYLNLLNPIEADKDGWNLGIKMLVIMTLIEQKEFDEATAKTDTFRKFIENGGPVSPRAALIFQLLKGLSYNGYDFKALYQKEKESVEMLADAGSDCAWQIKSPEMVIFHQWLFAKAFHQPFRMKLTAPAAKQIQAVNTNA